MNDTPILNICIRSVGTKGATGVLIRKLKEKDLYDPHFLYAGVEGKDVEELLLNGYIKGKTIGIDDIFFDNLILPYLIRHVPNVRFEDYIFVGGEESLGAPLRGIRNPLNCVGLFTPHEKEAEYPTLAIYNDIGLAPAINRNIKNEYLNRLMKFLDPNRKLDALVAVARFVVD